jgi:peptidyl-prolyl cis-trans isomerase B (cyclophilin B)
MKIAKNGLVLILTLALGVMLVALVGCGSGGKSESERELKDIEVEDMEVEDMTEGTTIEITMESGGKIVIELDPEAAPITTANFLKLVDEHFYDGLTFHRIIPDFMIQGGDPDGTGMGGLKEKIKGEFSQNGWDNPISHKRGVISMARTDDPNSASCQFFITNADSQFLDGGYAAFGIVTSGMEVVDEISAVPTDSNDKPNKPVVMDTIRRK